MQNLINTIFERTMCAKTFRQKVFWRYLFFKKGNEILRNRRAQNVRKNFTRSKVFWCYLFFKKGNEKHLSIN